MQWNTLMRIAVLAAYRADPTVTVRDLQARFGVGRNTISRWLREAGLSRPTGNRKGAAVGRQVEVEDDFKAVLLGWYGVGAELRKLTNDNLRNAGWGYDGDTSSAVDWLAGDVQGALAGNAQRAGFSRGFAITSPSAAALVDRAVGKSWRAIALDLLLDGQPTSSASPALLRRAQLDAVDLKRKVKRRLAALASDPTYRDAVEMFTTHWMSRRPAWMRQRRGRA